MRRTLSCFISLLACVGLAQGQPTGEDPELVAHAKAKGWTILRDIRISDGKRLIYLVVQDKNKPFEDVSLAANDYKMIARAKTVQVLDLRKVKLTDDGLKTIATIPNLEGIIISGEEVTDAGIKALAASKSLDNVSLFNTKKVTDAGIKELASLPKLQALSCMFFTLDGSCFAAFANSKSLTSLTLDYIDGLTDDGAKNIAKIPTLNELKIGSGFGEKKLTTAGIKAIVDTRLPAKFDFDKKLIDDALFETLVAKGWLYGPTPPGSKEKKPATPQEVQSINLDGSSVTDKGFAAVLNCTSAKYLFLAGTGITDASFQKLGGFRKLEYLALQKTKVGGAGLEAIAAAPIRHVAMEYCELTEDVFKALKKMQSLEELWLSDAKMKGEWLQHIANLPKLKELNLMRTDFDDAAVKHLVSLPALEGVTLNDTKLTDTGFLELLKRPKLRRLFVDSTKVTKEVYQKAKKENPKRSLYFYRYDQ